MAYVSTEERESFYQQYPPGTRVLLLERQKWFPGEVIERYGQHGTVYIRCRTDSGVDLTILYGARGHIQPAQRAGPAVNMGFNSGDDESP